MVQLSLSFLGTFQATLAGRPIAHFRSSNVQGILVFLVLQPRRAVTRDVLATLFWPDEAESIGRTNLRQSLYQLRKLLEDQDQQFLTISRQTVHFNPESDYQCDVHNFLKAIELGEYAKAVTRYGGDLLPGFACDSLEFEEWLRGERERLHGLAITAMDTLATRYLRNGRVEEAQDIARQHLALEPWSETAHRQLIEALALAGNRSAALAQVEQCRAVLAQELGVTLSAETAELAERIKKNALQPVDPDLLAGRYVLGDEIGRGAVGIVYRGRDSHTGAKVAIKMLDPDKVDRNPELLSRFLREGEALQQLNHPNIVNMLAVDEKDGRHYLIMEYVAGGDLKEALARKSILPLRESLTIALDLADALTRAHRLDILHRDLKPANVLLDENGLPRLSDFGIARLGQDSELTTQGEVLGTLAYLSPEACLGQGLDERSDIWSFGILLYEMLAGAKPFTVPTPAGTITQILNAPIPDLLAIRPDVPEELVDLLYRMLAKDRGGRIPSVRLVGAEIEAILHRIEKETDPERVEPQGDPPPAGRPVFDTPTPERLVRMRHNLPAQAIPFVGREAELAELERLLADPTVRLLTILGPGGMGKTRLALEVAGRQLTGTSATPVVFPHGIFLVELATLNSVEQMITAVATTLGFHLEKEIEPLEQILNFLSNKQLLLLMDNFEHLLAPPAIGAEVVTAFLRAAPDVKIIVTSQQKLNLSGEVLFFLEGLSFSDWRTATDALSDSAAQLFIQSARRARIDFELTTDNLPPVTRICHLSEGMPLGILLAAAWIELLSLDEIADEMQADIDFLAGEMGDLPPRQRSMRAIFEHAWSLLTEPEQQVLARLSVFRGGFTREAAQAVTGATLRQLLALVNKSLVQRDVTSGRFALHELLRQLAAEKLEAKGETEALLSAHSHYYLSWVADLKDDLHRYKQLETTHILRRDEENIQAAWLSAATKGHIGDLLSIIQSFPDYMMLTGRAVDARRLYNQALLLLPPGDITFTDTADDVTFLRASLLNRLQDIGFDQDERGQPIDIDRLHAFFQARGAKLEEALVCQHLAYRALRTQNFPQAMAFFQTQTEIYEQENEVFRSLLSVGRVSMLALYAGQIEVALELGQRAAALAEKYNSFLFTSSGLFFLVLYLLFEKYDYATAQEKLAELTTISRKHWTEGFGAINLLGGLIFQGATSLLQGHLAEARQFSQEMFEIAEITNSPWDKLRAESLASLIRATKGQYESVNLEALESREGGVLSIGPIGTALTAYGRGNSRVALTTVIQAWSVPIAMRWLSIPLQYMPVVASLLADGGEYSRAVALLAMARIHPGCPRGWWEIMALMQELEARLRAELSPEEYERAQARGREMDVRETAVSLLEELKTMATSEPGS